MAEPPRAARIMREGADGWEEIGSTDMILGFDAVTPDGDPVVATVSGNTITIDAPLGPDHDKIVEWLRGPRGPRGPGGTAMTISGRRTRPVVPRTGKRPADVSPAQWRAQLRLNTLARRRRRRAGLPLTVTADTRTVLPHVTMLAGQLSRMGAAFEGFTARYQVQAPLDALHRAAIVNRITR